MRNGGSRHCIAAPATRIRQPTRRGMRRPSAAPKLDITSSGSGRAGFDYCAKNSHHGPIISKNEQDTTSLVRLTGAGGVLMFNPTQLVIDTFVEQLKAAYIRTYGLLEPEYPNVIAFVGRIALENIANSDAPYHDVNHTILVTEVGQEILKGRHISRGGVGPR